MAQFYCILLIYVLEAYPIYRVGTYHMLLLQVFPAPFLWHHAGNLKSDRVEKYTTGKLANAQIQDFLLSHNCCIYMYVTASKKSLKFLSISPLSNMPILLFGKYFRAQTEF